MIWIESVRPATKSEIKKGEVAQKDCHETFAEVLQRAIRWTKREQNTTVCHDMPRNDN